MAEEIHGEKSETQSHLVRRAKAGDKDAFVELYDLYYREMYAYASYMLRHPQDAEDVVSDTVTAAFEGIGKLRDETRFRQWLFKILSNQCKKKRKGYLERNKHLRLKKETEDVDEENTLSDGRNMEQELTDREWVQAAFDQLTEEEKYIVNSFLFGGFKGKEIAESLGIGDSTLRSKYRRALQKMKAFLEC